jgi:hypothetical protein
MEISERITERNHRPNVPHHQIRRRPKQIHQPLLWLLLPLLQQQCSQVRAPRTKK